MKKKLKKTMNEVLKHPLGHMANDFLNKKSIII